MSSRRRQRSWGWAGPIFVAIFALVIRVWNLGFPKDLLFDETYYAKDAWSLLKFGYVQGYLDNVDDKIAAGNLSGIFADHLAMIVHPEVGKAMIAAGEWALGMNAVGWRIAAALTGALTVLVLARLVRRLTGSTALGCFAGMLLALDGLHFVMSRLALLDVFLAFWLLCAVACLVADHDQITRRLAVDGRWRRLRPWQLSAGICFGLAVGTKWSALPVLAVFGLAVVGWEIYERRRAESLDPTRVRPRTVPLIMQVGAPAFGSLVVVAFAVYLATWTGWLLHYELYARQFGAGRWTVGEPSGGLAAVPDAFKALWEYHQMVWNFHTGQYISQQHHPYQSNAFGWLLLDRPVNVDAHNGLPAAMCDAGAHSSCMRTIRLLGNPVVWWGGCVATIGGLMLWTRSRDWRWTVPMLGIFASWVPWLLVVDRPIFSFYAVVTLPFLIIAIAMVIDAGRSRAETRGDRLLWNAVIWSVLAVTALAFVWFYPILTDGLIRTEQWRQRLWFSNWN